MSREFARQSRLLAGENPPPPKPPPHISVPFSLPLSLFLTLLYSSIQSVNVHSGGMSISSSFLCSKQALFQVRGERRKVKKKNSLFFSRVILQVFKKDHSLFYLLSSSSNSFLSTTLFLHITLRHFRKHSYTSTQMIYQGLKERKRMRERENEGERETVPPTPVCGPSREIFFEEKVLFHFSVQNLRKKFRFIPIQSTTSLSLSLSIFFLLSSFPLQPQLFAILQVYKSVKKSK